MTEQKIDAWSVTVNVNNEDVLTIGHSHVSGIADFDDVAPIIRTCAAHLLSFIGEGPDHLGNHIALSRAILQAATSDDMEARFIAKHGHRLATLFLIDAFDLADRDAQIMAVLAATRNSPSADVGHACATKMRATMVRLGVFPGEGLEWFQANIEDNIYLMCREVNKLLDAITASAPSADAVDAHRWRYMTTHNATCSVEHMEQLIDGLMAENAARIAASAPKGDGND